jgi:hypothetical protein
LIENGIGADVQQVLDGTQGEVAETCVLEDLKGGCVTFCDDFAMAQRFVRKQQAKAYLLVDESMRWVAWPDGIRPIIVDSPVRVFENYRTWLCARRTNANSRCGNRGRDEDLAS